MALKLKGSTSGFVAIDAPSVAGNNTLILPENTGSAQQLLGNDITAGVVTFTSVTVNRNGDLTVPGIISIGGTLTYEDVTSVDSVGIVTARSGVRINGGGLTIIGDTTGLKATGVSTFVDISARNITGAAATFSGIAEAVQFKLGDNAKALYGDSGDLQIYHSTNSLIQNGTGALQIITTTGNLFLRGQDSITFNTAGNNERMRIASDGKIGMDGSTSPEEVLDIGNNTQVNLKIGGRGYLGQGYSTAATILGHSVKAKTTGTVSGGMEVTETNSGGGAPSAIRMQNGRFEFHTDSSGTQGATFDAERLRIDSSGRLLIGTTSHTSHAMSSSTDSKIQLESINAADYGRMSFVYNGNNGVGPGLWFGKSRGTSIGSNTVVQNGDQIGGFFFHAADGTDKHSRVASIVCNIDGAPGANDTPGRIDFSTTSDGASATKISLSIKNSGLIQAPFQYFLYAKRSGNQTGYDSTANYGTPMIYNQIVTENKDSSLASCFNTSNGLFTAPITGTYIFFAGAYTTTGNVFQQCWYTINGSRGVGTDTVQANQTTYAFVQGSTVLRLSAGDTVGFKPYGNNSNVTISQNDHHTYFRVSLLH